MTQAPNENRLAPTDPWKMIAEARQQRGQIVGLWFRQIIAAWIKPIRHVLLKPPQSASLGKNNQIGGGDVRNFL